MGVAFSGHVRRETDGLPVTRKVSQSPIAFACRRAIPTDDRHFIHHHALSPVGSSTTVH